jgi:uncharacterized membrane protein YoaK (UPF0700 family)
MPPDQLEQINNAGSGSPISGIIFLAIIIVMIAAMWKIFTKPGEPGWAAIVPIYNIIVLLKISGKPLWWLILLIIPVVNFVVGIIVALGLAERFGKGGGFGVGLALLPFIFYPILAFSDAAYVGPKAA